MKKIGTIILIGILCVLNLLSPLQAQEPVNNSKTNEIEEEQKKFSSVEITAFDFTIKESKLVELTPSDVVEKATASSSNNEQILIEQESFNNLKNGGIGIHEVKLFVSEVEKKINVVVVANDYITPTLLETNQSVKAELVDYIPGTGMNVDNVYDMKINVDFGDTSSENKQVNISLPAGLRYANYPTNNVIDSSVEKQATGVLGDFMKSVQRPVIDLGKGYSGDLNYEFISAAEAIEFIVKVRVDEHLYFNPGTIAGNIKVNAIKGAGVNLGEVEFPNVKTIGPNSAWVFTRGEATVQQVVNNETVTTARLSLVRRTMGGDLQGYVKKYTLYYYYPKELTFVNSSHDSHIVEHNATLGYVKFEIENSIITTPINLNLKANSLTNGVEYIADAPTRIEIQTYNDEVLTYADNSLLSKITVKDPNDIQNKFKVTLYRNGYYQNVDPSYTSRGPGFFLKNVEPAVLSKQWFQLDIDANYETTRVYIPRLSDKNKVYYQTSLNGTYRQIPAKLISDSNHMRNSLVNIDGLNLKPGETLTTIKSFIKEVPINYTSYDPNATDELSGHLGTIGRLKIGINNANINLRMYSSGDEDPSSPALSDTEAVSLGTVIVPSYNGTTFYREMENQIITAGEKKNVSGLLRLSRIHSNQTTDILVNPTLYIKLVDDLRISNPVVTVNGQKLPVKLTSEYTTSTGAKYAKIEVTGLAGGFIDDKNAILYFSFDMSVGLNVRSKSYFWRDLIFVKDELNTDYFNSWNNPNPVADIDDVNNNNNLSEKLMPVGAAGTNLTINTNENLLIDTYIYPEGETRKPPYDETDDSTAIGFTPGTKGIYTVDILNNVNGLAKDIEAYVPIPKETNNFGKKFQTNEFKWNMKLGAAPTLKVEDEFGNDITATKKGNYNILYSMTATNETNYENASYSNTFNSDATMIKIKNTTGMVRGERAYLVFDYNIDETAQSITDTPGKLGAINDFRPYYSFDTGTLKGGLSGTKVGARLEIGSISGIAFLDENYNGTYETSDVLLAGKTVDLYKRDAQGDYQFISSAITAIDGSYKFDNLSNGNYQVDFSGLLSSGQKFTAKNIGLDQNIDSDVETAGINVGKAIDINPTATQSRTIYAGVINYTAPSIMFDKNNTSLKVNNEQNSNISELLSTLITPSYFDLIKSGKTIWESDDSSIVTVDNNGVIRGVTMGTTKVKATIKDIYDASATAEITVTVTSNDIPVLTGTDLTIEAGSEFNPELTNVVISDTEDGIISLSDSKVTITNHVPLDTNGKANIPGVYSVIYEVIDSDNNIANTTIQVTVEDTIAPNIIITYPKVYVALNDIKTDTELMNIAGITATDITNTQVISLDSTAVDYMMVGEYPVTINAVDASGNRSTAQLEVEVIEMITAEDFEVALKDVANADFVSLANVKAFEITQDMQVNEISAVLSSIRPTSVGMHGVTFTSSFATIDVEVNVLEDFSQHTMKASDFTISYSELVKAIQSDNLENEILTRSNAKAWKNDTLEELTPLQVTNLTSVTERPLIGTYNVIIYYGDQPTNDVTFTSSYSATLQKEVQMKVINDPSNGLPSTGQNIMELIVVSLLILMISLFMVFSRIIKKYNK